MSIIRVTACMLIAAAVVMPHTARAADNPPCEMVDSSAFANLNGAGTFAVIDVGDVVKERGNNICSILIDTTQGRIKFVFTTARTVTGAAMWKRLSFKVVE